MHDISLHQDVPRATNPEPRSFYQQWYAQNIPSSYGGNQLWQQYVRQLQAFIETLGIRELRGLEVGSGGGQLQHVLERYVGIDIAASAGRFMARPFSAASATALPFPDETFDIVWSIWTLEHVFDPEKMLYEMRRVTRSGGHIFLCAAWCVPDWVTRGYRRGTWHRQKLPALLLRMATYPRRWFGWYFLWCMRAYWLLHGPMSRLAYHFLLPSYTASAEPDADACVHIDAAAVILWFQAHNAHCISHPTWNTILTVGHDEPLIFRVS